MNLRSAIRFENMFTTGNVASLIAIIATGAIWYAQMNATAAQVPKNTDAIMVVDRKVDATNARVSVLEAERNDDIETRKEVIRRLRDLQQSVDAINNRGRAP